MRRYFILVVIIAALGIILSASPCAAVTPQDAASTSGNQALDNFTQGKMQSNVINPLLGSDNLKTIDGSNQGSARVSCQASDNFLSVLIQPTSANDLNVLSIYQDTDMDGSVDYSYTLPFLVSGICANGVISCDPGAWTNCSYYKWTADANGHATAKSSYLTDLGGCYCINSSCGSNLVWTNTNTILKDLGGGIAGAVIAQKRQYALSAVKLDTMAIYYTGQDESTCTSGNSYSTGATPQSYAQAPTTVQAQKYIDYSSDLDAAKDDEVIKQAADPNSYYSLITNSAFASNAVTQSQSCTIKRNVTVQTSETCSSGGSYYTTTDECIDTNVSCNSYCGSVSGCDFVLTPLNISGPGWRRSGIRRIETSGSTITRTDWGDGSSSSVFVTIPGHQVTGGFSNCGSPGCIDRITASGDTIYFWACRSGYATCKDDDIFSKTDCIFDYSKCHVAGTVKVDDVFITYDESTCDEQLTVGTISNNTISFGYQYCDMGKLHFFTAQCEYPPTKTDTVHDAIDNQCTALASNANCTLQSEKVDGVITWVNNQSTGLTPVPSCKIFTGATSNRVCHDWWEKDRIYQCKMASSYDFSDAKRRTGVIAGSVTGSPDTGMYYNDAPRDASGNIISTSGYADLSQTRYDVAHCMQACKTRRVKQDTQASLSGTTNQWQNNAQTYEFLFHKCKSGSCPAGSGETIMKDCQCIDDFAESISILAAVNEGAKDMICSSGTKK
jgi:hypothetical protein